MDNFGYREPGVEPKASKRVRVKRSVSTQSSTDTNLEEYLLSRSTYRRFSTVNSQFKKDLNVALNKEILSDDFHHMLSGPSPSIESTFSINFSYEESSKELNVEISPDTIRQTLTDFIEISTADKLLVKFIISGVNDNGICIENFNYSSKPEKDIYLLLATFYKRTDLVDHLLTLGADTCFRDPGGMSALHLSAFVGCLKSTETLISKAVDIDVIYKYFSPLHCAIFGNNLEIVKLLIQNGADPTLTTKKTNCEESIIHCAVRADAVECLNFLISLQVIDVNAIQPSGANPIHLASELGRPKCLELLLEVDKVNINSKTRIRDKMSTALHLAAEEGRIECLKILLMKGADVLLKNHRGLSALHLAAKSSDLQCVELLMRNGNSDPNSEDFDKRTPLHVAVRKSEKTFIIMKKLICWGADVNKQDEYGYTPLHMAALDGLSECVEMLIDHGADVTMKSRNHCSALSIIKKKTPVSLIAVTKKLNDSIVLLNNESANDCEVQIRFNFRYIIHLDDDHTHEISFLESFVKEGQKDILTHPLCSAFLHIKWMKVRMYYLGRFFFYFVFVLLLSLYVLTALAHNCYNISKDDDIENQELCQNQSMLGKLLRKNPFVIEMQWYFLAGFTVFEFFRKIYGIVGYSNVQQYFTQIQNLMDWFVIISVLIISCIYTKSTYLWQSYIGSFAVLAGWTNLMFMVGQFPIFGSYVAMYQKVQKEFAKLFMAYACILIGFTLSFCVIFPNSPMFANPFMSFITVLMMMIGEQDLSLLSNEPDEIDPPFLFEVSAQITFVLFLTSVTIVLMNLLVGIAVPDITKLRKTAGLSKLVSQTMLISYMELALSNALLPKCLKRFFCKPIMISNQLPRMMLDIEPLNPEENRLPKDIVKTAYDVASKRLSNNYNTRFDQKFDLFKFEKSDYNTNVKTKYNKSDIPIIESKLENDVKMVKTLRNEVSELKCLINIQKNNLEKLMRLTAK